MGSFTNKFVTYLVIFLHLSLITKTLIHSFSETGITYYGMLLISLLSTISFYKTITSRNEIRPQVRNDHSLLILGSALIKNNKTTREIMINGMNYKEELCSICNLFMAKNVFHCRKCQICVLNHDHHCFWIDNCVGSHNYKFFMYTINTTLLLLVYNTFKNSAMDGGIVNTVLFLIQSVSLITFVLLCSYFWILLVLNINSREFMKRDMPIRGFLLKRILRKNKKKNHMNDNSTV